MRLEGHHTVLGLSFEEGGDLMQTAGADEIGDREGVFEDLHGDAASAGSVCNKSLADHVGERHGKLRCDFLGSFPWEHIDDAGDGALTVAGVEGGEDEVAGFCGGHGERDGFAVAHFADENDVWILAKGAFESCGEGGDVPAEFALGEEGGFAFEDVLDGVFEADDANGAVSVDVVGERGDGGGFAAAGVTGEQDEAALETTDVLPNVFFGEADLLDGRDVCGKGSDDGGDAVSVVEDVETKGDLFFLPFPGGVDVCERIGLEARPVFLAEHGMNEGLDHFRRERRAVANGSDVAVIAEGDGVTDFEVEV